MNNVEIDSRGYRADFWPYHYDNPQVFEGLNRVNLMLMRRGFERGSMYLALERLRWETAIRANDPAAFKVNNNFRPDYARLWLETYPEHAGFLAVRERKIVRGDFDGEAHHLLS